MKLRRSDDSPRLELTPLIDVIFLLLTFFIYNLIISVQAEVLPVRFTDVKTGQRATGGDVQWLQIDRKGAVSLNREPLTDAQLEAKLEAIGRMARQPTLYLVVDAAGDTDRAPLLITLFERVKKAGVQNVTFVGQPARP
jgi:biopolymer transport protein ExbD